MSTAASHATSDTSEETCTGDFEDKKNPRLSPPGTKCARTCIYVGKGYYYGDSYCYTTNNADDVADWGATCKRPNGNDS